MERAIAEMEKIRRAEEIYSKRKNAEDEEKKPRNIYKTLFEMLFFVNVIIIILAVQNQKYIFTEDFIKRVNEYNVNVKKKVDELFSNKSEAKKEVPKENKENIVEENKGVSGESNDVQSALVENDIVLNSEENNISIVDEEKVELSQEEQDILNVKNYSIIMPVSGVKTSGFGERESTNSKVTKYHTGVDIAAKKGEAIVSSTSGKVVQVSNSGDYGKHLKVQTDDLIVLYAHCSQIDVKEGQEIEQGQKIAEVGSTGNSTGPHLHFEIRYQDRFVNPEKILEF